jgi:hypothetical protein
MNSSSKTPADIATDFLVQTVVGDARIDKDVVFAAECAGISRATLFRAAKRLGMTQPDKPRRSIINSGAFDAAVDFLRWELQKRDARPISIIVKEAHEVGISRSTIFKAAKHLRVQNPHGLRKSSIWVLPRKNFSRGREVVTEYSMV